MKILVLVVLPFIAMTSFSFGNSFADSTKEEHNLQQRCDEDAKQHFERYYDTGYYKSHGITSLYHYTSHYNTKLNKCFVLLMGELTPYNVEEMGKHSVTTNNELWDISENKVCRWFLKFDKFEKPINCRFLGKECNSEGEWDSFVKPYMED